MIYIYTLHVTILSLNHDNDLHNSYTPFKPILEFLYTTQIQPTYNLHLPYTHHTPPIHGGPVHFLQNPANQESRRQFLLSVAKRHCG